MEALEIGSTTLLIDEDTCATNFMIRDAAMVELVAPHKEPITPFIKKVRPLFTDLGVSTIMVIGGSGDFFSVADTVICMERYQASDVTQEAKRIAEKHSDDVPQHVSGFPRGSCRAPCRDGLAANGKVSARSLRCISYGETEIELTYVEQLVEISQARAIADCLQLMAAKTRFVDGRRTIAEVVELVNNAISAKGEVAGTQGLDVLSYESPCPFYAKPRHLEIAAALNRLRTAQISRVAASSSVPKPKLQRVG